MPPAAKNKTAVKKRKAATKKGGPTARSTKIHIPASPDPEVGAGEENPRARPGGNKWNRKEIDGALADIAKEQAEIDRIMAKAKYDCSEFKNQISQIRKDTCKSTGMPPKVFNAFVAEDKQVAKLERIVRGDGLSADQRETLDEVRHALGRAEGLGGTAFGDWAERIARSR